jgi:hypothetical protein
MLFEKSLYLQQFKQEPPGPFAEVPPAVGTERRKREAKPARDGFDGVAGEE